jgi:hypothetical protein
MKTTILLAVLSLGLLSATTTYSQVTEPVKVKHEKMVKASYVCPMHADMKSVKPAKCSQCGMNMKKMDMNMKKMDMPHNKMNMKKDSIMMKHDSVKMSHEKMTKMYACPMHADITSDKTGKCSKCDMMLVEKKMDMKKDPKKEDDHKDHKH